MQVNYKSLIIPLIQGILFIFLVSCTTVPKDFVMLNSEQSEKIPLRAGLYLKPDIQRCEARIYFVSEDTYDSPHWHVGDALVSGIERTARNIFQEVSTVDPTQKLDSQRYDIIVTPELVHVEIRGIPHRPFIAETVIKWNIVSPDGKVIYENTIKGTDEIRGFSLVKKNIIRSLQDHFQKAQQDIYSSGWWKKQWWKEPNH